jgi:hypothetical protein
MLPPSKHRIYKQNISGPTKSADLIKEAIMKFGENIKIGKNCSLELGEKVETHNG